MTSVIVLVGAGSIGQAIARRVGAGRHVLLADLRQENADAAAKTLSEAGLRSARRQWMYRRAPRSRLSFKKQPRSARSPA